MALNRLQTGTSCTVRATGQTGTIKHIYFYPTKYEIEFPDGTIEHHSSKNLDIEGVKQKPVERKISPIPENGIGEYWNSWYPFKGESKVKHHFFTTKEIMWDMLTSLEIYNVWFHGIQRALPIIETERYVHQYSFDHFELKPGNYFKIRPKTIAPWFPCRILTIEKEKKFGFTFKTNPLIIEYIEFSIQKSDSGVWVTCKRSSKGIFSILSQFNWQEKSQILQNLDHIIPKVKLIDPDANLDNDKTNQTLQNMSGGGIETLPDNEKVAYFTNKGLDGDFDTINAYPDKKVRGKAKAMIIKIKRGSVERPAMPELKTTGTTSTGGGGLNSLPKDQLIAYLVNKGLDGDMDIINNQSDKIIRGKVKAMIVKINRGSVERPAMPEIPSNESISSAKNDSKNKETDEETINRLIMQGIDGNMDEINALENKVLRGKIKAGIMKAKRAKK